MIIAESARINIKDQNLLLLPEKALFWEEEKGLIISDVHLGKAGHFRKNGIALPQSSNDENLIKINSLVQSLNPYWILFLGDLFHSIRNKEWDTFKHWRDSHPSIEVILVMGNHELYPKAEYKMMGVNCFEEYITGPFLFVHEDDESNSKTDVFKISGHIHPSIRMKGKGRQSIRIPCFYFDDRKAILPAFGRLTGTHNVKPSKNAQIYGVLEHQILQIL